MHLQVKLVKLLLEPDVMRKADGIRATSGMACVCVCVYCVLEM